MKKLVKILIMAMLVGQYVSPMASIAQEEGSVSSTEQTSKEENEKIKESSEQIQNSQTEKSQEEQVVQPTQATEDHLENSTVANSEEASNAPPSSGMERATSENGPVGPDITTGPKVIGKIVDAPYVSILDPNTFIDSKYSFTPIFTSETKTTYIENGSVLPLGSQNTVYIKKATVTASQNTYVKFDNIGYYNGRKLGMNVVPVEFTGNEFQIVIKNIPAGAPTLGDYQPGSIRNTPSSLPPVLEYRFFYEDTNEDAEITGHFNMGQLDLQEWLAFYPETNIVQSLVVRNNVLNQIELPAGTVSGVARQSTDGNSVSLNDPRNTFSITFGPTTKVKLKPGAERSGSTNSTIGFSRLFPGNFDNPDPIKEVENKTLEEKNATFNITQLMPNRTEDNQYTSFILEDTIEDVLTINNVQIFNGLGTNVSNNFTIQTIGQKVTASAQPTFLTDVNNYGQYYIMKISTTLKDNLTPEQIKKYQAGNLLDVPNTADRTFDTDKSSTNKVSAQFSGIIKPAEVTGEKLVNGTTGTKAYPGDTLTYTINLTHKDGTGEWSGSITDTLPQNLTFVPGTTTFNGQAQDDNVVWKDGVLTIPNVTLNDSDKTAKVEFQATVGKEAVGTSVVNKVEAQPTPPVDPSDPNNPKTPEIPAVPTEVVPSAGALETSKKAFDEAGQSIDNQMVKVGDVIEYRVSAKNKSAAETIVNNVQVSDTIPAGLSYEAGSLKATYPDGTTKALPDSQVNGQQLDTENLGNLKGGEEVVVSFKVKVTEQATGTIKNVATVKATVPPENPNDPDKPLDPEEPQVSVGIPGEVTGEKLVNGTTGTKAYPGDTLTYTIKLTHKDGTGQWSGSITDTLPQNLSFVPGTTTFNGQAQDDNVVWKDGVLTVPNVTVNDLTKTATVEFQATVGKEALGTTVVNKAEAQPTPPIDPSDPNNPKVPEIPEVPTEIVPSAGALETSKSGYNQAGQSIDNQTVKVGDIIEYRVSAKNKSAAETIVNNVQVSDTIPTGLSYEAGTLKATYPDGTTKTLSDSQVNGPQLDTENLGSLKGGEEVVASFKVKVTEQATGTIKNVAIVKGTVPPEKIGDPEKPLDPEEPQVSVGIPGEVTGEKLVNGTTGTKAYPGDTLTYTIKLTHKDGTGQWSGSITDTLPQNLSFVPGTTTFNGQAQDDSIVWKDGVLTVPNVTVNDKNKTAIVEFQAILGEEALGTTVVNKAEAQPTPPIDPSDPNNPKVPEIPEVPTKVIKRVGVFETSKKAYDEAGQSIDNQTVKVGDIIEYRVSAKNKSAADAIINNVQVSDTIPSGLSYEAGTLKATYSDGTVKNLPDSQVNGQQLDTENLGSLDGGEEVVVSFKVKVTEQATGTMKNVASVKGTVPSENPGDPDKPLDPDKPQVSVGIPGEVTGEKLVNGTLETKVYPGDTVTYTIRLTHKDGTGQWNGSIIDRLPSNLNYVPGTTTFNGQAQDDTDVWKNNVLTVPNVIVNDKNETATVEFKATVGEEATGSTVVNKAQAITPRTDPVDPNKPKEPEIPGVPTEVMPKAGTLETSKKAYDEAGKSTDNQMIKVGDIIEYRVSAKNKSAAETIVNNVQVSDTIPAGLSYESGTLKATYPDGTTKALPDSQVNGQQLDTQNLGSLKGGEEVIVSFKVKVTEQATGTVKNIAIVNGTVPPVNPGDPDEPLDPEKPEITVTTTPSQPETPGNTNSTSKGQLLNAGETMNYLLPVVGIGIILIVLGYRTKRKGSK